VLRIRINADPDPTFHFNAGPVPNFYFDADANPARIKVMQICKHWPAVQTLHGSIASTAQL
jgi:hypothetical protein